MCNLRRRHRRRRVRASNKQLKLEDALGSTKWRMITHFYEATYALHGDKAKVIDTEDAGGTIKGVKAVLTMQGQEAEPEAVYPVLAFLQAWVPEPEATEADDEVPPELRVDPQRSSLWKSKRRTKSST